MAIPAYAAPGIIMRRRKTHNFRQSRMFAEFVTHRRTSLGFGDGSRAEGDSSSRLRSPRSLYDRGPRPTRPPLPRLHQVPGEGSADRRELCSRKPALPQPVTS
jgi:hypothetical protein